MKRISRSNAAISNGIFGAAVVVLIVVAAIGYGLYGTAASKPAITTTLTVTTTNVSTEMITSETAMMNHTSMTEMSGNSSTGCACTFTPKPGAMITSAWFVSAPTETTNQFAVSVHAEGLEPNGTYIVEGTLMTGPMVAVPISSQAIHMNTTSASEFQANKNGTGNFFILLNSNPITTFENMEILFLSGNGHAKCDAGRNFEYVVHDDQYIHDGNIDDDVIYHELVILRESSSGSPDILQRFCLISDHSRSD